MRDSSFTDSRVTFVFGNKDVLSKPGERRQTPTSGYRIGLDPGTSVPFLEQLHDELTGYESFSHFVVYRKFESAWPRWEADVALAGLLSVSQSSGTFELSDSGSYIRILRKLGDGAEGETQTYDLTAWPLSTDRFRLGSTHVLSWADNAAFPGKTSVGSFTRGSVPGIRLRWRSPRDADYVFAGLKSALLTSRVPGLEAGEFIPNFAALFGAGMTLGDAIMFEAHGAYVEKGTQERPGLEGEPIYSVGTSGAITLFHGTFVRERSDLRLYRDDTGPWLDGTVLRPYEPGSGYFVSLEGVYQTQSLEDPERFGRTKPLPGIGVGLSGNLKIDELSVTLYAFLRTAGFILFDVPGFVPFQALADATETEPELTLSAKLEYDVTGLALRPALRLGILFPATLTSSIDEGARVQVLVNGTDRIVLPVGIDARPVFAGMFEVPFAPLEGSPFSTPGERTHDSSMLATVE
ncbi:MAG: hypothetical protein HY791_28880 [Deltaproteobacteria bacterium]|nr:hypothetical protein [Deltaproteobacteria bacterium]